MTDTAQASIPVAAAPTAMAPLDRQRQSLQQVVSLSLECAAEEQRVEQAHTEAAAR